MQNALTSKIASIGGFELKDIKQPKTAQCKMCLDYNHLLADLKQKLQDTHPQASEPAIKRPPVAGLAWLLDDGAANSQKTWHYYNS